MPPVSQEFLEPEISVGSLRRSGGERVAALSLEFVQSLHVALLEQFADDAQDVLYRSGYEWSLQEMVALNQRLRRTLGGGDFDLWQMDAKFILDSWWAPRAEAGWGRCSFDLSSLTRGVALVELGGSAVVAAFPSSEQPVCHLYAGMFAGALSFFERSERHAVEIQCESLAQPRCQFVVAPAAAVDSAEMWRQQGLAPAEIIQRLR